MSKDKMKCRIIANDLQVLCKPILPALDEIYEVEDYKKGIQIFEEILEKNKSLTGFEFQLIFYKEI